jgi:sugar lactone lactonase YvrE
VTRETTSPKTSQQFGCRPAKRAFPAAAAAVVAVGIAAIALPSTAPAGSQPETIPLPPGFQPEGIASGKGNALFVGSIPTGAVWAGNARTGKGAVRVPAHDGRAAIGVKFNRGRLFVAGGPTGDAFVYRASNGRDLASYDLAPDGANTFVNDVVVTRKAAYYTDSRIQQLYKVPLGKRGKLPRQSKVRTLPLTGDIVYGAGNNANGIVAAKGGSVLIVVQSNTGKLFRVSPKSGRTKEIDLGGASVTNGDGLLLRGRKLYVVQNRDNKIAVVKLNKRLSSGTIASTITDPDFDVPTTLAFTRGQLFAVNARFGTTPTPETEYDVVRVG